ncbi:alpha-N-acetylglucosaminidase C-terminal domain-containing protein [Pedobacter sp. NJ-S-72]
MLQTHPSFRLDTWVRSAADFGQTPADKTQAVWNAKTQISYWGPDNAKTDLHEYANKEWGGLMGTLYLNRWEVYTAYLSRKLKGENPAEPDFFEMEKKWANAAEVPEKPITKNAVTMALSILEMKR